MIGNSCRPYSRLRSRWYWKCGVRFFQLVIVRAGPFTPLPSSPTNGGTARRGVVCRGGKRCPGSGGLCGRRDHYDRMFGRECYGTRPLILCLLPKYGAGGVICGVRSTAVGTSRGLIPGSWAIPREVSFPTPDTFLGAVAVMAGVAELLALVALRRSLFSPPGFDFHPRHAE